VELIDINGYYSIIYMYYLPGSLYPVYLSIGEHSSSTLVLGEAAGGPVGSTIAPAATVVVVGQNVSATSVQPQLFQRKLKRL